MSFMITTMTSVTMKTTIAISTSASVSVSAGVSVLLKKFQVFRLRGPHLEHGRRHQSGHSAPPARAFGLHRVCYGHFGQEFADSPPAA